jgi:hypothetical protein
MGRVNMKKFAPNPANEFAVCAEVQVSYYSYRSAIMGSTFAARPGDPLASPP